MTDLKKILKEKELVIGTERTLKNLKLGKIKKVFLAKNCSAGIREEIKRYAGINKIEVEELDVSNEELGGLCKKPYSVTVLSY